MFQRWLQSYQLLHGLIAVIAAAGFFRFWKRTRFWLPTYVHVIAIISFVLGVAFVWLLATAPKLRDPHGPSPGTQRLAQLLLPFIFPAIVYFFFIFYGGQHAAFNRSAIQSIPCPFWGAALPAYRGDKTAVRFVEPICSNCGQSLHL